jgi:hypothetical protein
MQAQMAQMQQQIQMALAQANIQKLNAQAAKDEAQALETAARTEQTRIETAILTAVPDPSPNINI